MNRTGWQVLVEADQKPDSYSPTDDLFTADRSSLYGVMLRSKGNRYNSELNGTRASGWGEGQNYDFQGTAPFLALRSPKPLAEAVAEGVAEALKDPQIRRDMGQSTDPRQIVHWMTDLTNIVLMDFILSQQDRVGNIDHTDDHLRNHGFLRALGGWRLSPAFDINPEHRPGARMQTAISEIHGNLPSIDAALDASAFFDIDRRMAEQMTGEMARHIAGSWHRIGGQLGMDARDFSAVGAAIETEDLAKACRL
jgi:hypothetical protein